MSETIVRAVTKGNHFTVYSIVVSISIRLTCVRMYILL